MLGGMLQCKNVYSFDIIREFNSIGSILFLVIYVFGVVYDVLATLPFVYKE
jgi:hypothetical protein